MAFFEVSFFLGIQEAGDTPPPLDTRLVYRLPSDRISLFKINEMYTRMKLAYPSFFHCVCARARIKSVIHQCQYHGYIRIRGQTLQSRYRVAANVIAF